LTQTVTLELPLELVQRAIAAAARTGRRYEDVLVEWMTRAESSWLEDLSDKQVLAACDVNLPDEEQEQLSDLLRRQREGDLQPVEKAQLEQLLEAYRRGLVRKAQALRAAVSRGLRPPLGEP
jgi:hypothetical protein